MSGPKKYLPPNFKMSFIFKAGPASFSHAIALPTNQKTNRLVDNHVDVSVPISMSLVSPFECLTRKPKAIIWWLQETFSQENL